MSEIRNPVLTADEKNAIRSTLSSLVSIPSVKAKEAPGAPYGKDTLRALEYMLDLGRKNGFSVKNLDGRAGYIEWGSKGKIMGLLCHLDVVPAGEGWVSDPFTLRCENGRLIGRGICDDKGPAVILFYAMLRLKTLGYHPTCRIRLILGLDEECGSTCMEHYKKVEELPACGFTPDADFPAIFAEKGILQLRISGPVSKTIRVSAGVRPNMVPARCKITFLNNCSEIIGLGVPVHASKPHLGKNAIYEALSQLDKAVLDQEILPAFFMREIGSDTSGQFLFPGLFKDISGALTLNAGVLTMDDSKSEMLVDIRYPVTANADTLLLDVRRQVSDCGLEVEIYSHQMPLYLDPDEPLIKTLLKTYEKYVKIVSFDASTETALREKALISPVRPVAIGGGTYARTMPGLAAFGPSFPWEKDQAHQIDESMCEDTVYLLVHLYQDAIVAVCENMTAQD